MDQIKWVAGSDKDGEVHAAPVKVPASAKNWTISKRQHVVKFFDSKDDALQELVHERRLTIKRLQRELKIAEIRLQQATSSQEAERRGKHS